MEPLISPFNRANKVCTICFKAFKDESKLSEHIRLCSIGVKQEADLEIEDDLFDVPESSSSVFDKKDEAEKQITFKCDECKLSFTKLKQLLSHEKSHVKYRCAHCDDRIFTTKIKLVSHMAIHSKTAIEEQTCKLCSKLLSSKKYMQEHSKNCKRRIERKNKKNQRCKLCNLMFQNELGLRSHMKIHVHGIACRFCDKIFKCGESLVNHELDHIEKSPNEKELQDFYQHIKILDKYFECTYFECRFCTKKFQNREDIVEHLNLHWYPQPKNCRICFLSVNYLKKLKYHMKYKHTDKIRRKSSCFLCLEHHMAGHFEGEEKELTCTFCKNVLSCKKSLEIHTKICPQNENVTINADLDTTSPTMMDNNIIDTVNSLLELGFKRKKDAFKKYLRTKNNAENKRKRSTKKFKCPECTKLYVSEASVKKHLKEHSKKCKSFICKYCALQFKKAKHLQRHMEMHKNGFKCRICDMSFRRFDPFLNHEYGHIDQRPDENELAESIVHLSKPENLNCTTFECKFCSRKFQSHCNIMEHLELHKNPNPTNCLICKSSVTCNKSIVHSRQSPRLYSKQGSCFLCLEAHMASHFNENFKECPTCKNVFSCRKSLEIHMRIHNDNQKNIVQPAIANKQIKTEHVYLIEADQLHTLEPVTVFRIKSEDVNEIEASQSHILESVIAPIIKSEVVDEIEASQSHISESIIAPIISQIEASQSYTVTALNIESEGYISNITDNSEHSEVVQPINTKCINRLQNTRYYNCKLCLLSFLSIKLLDKHEVVHKSPYLYRCNECRERFPTILKYKRHKHL